MIIKKFGFTLIELIITIVLLGIVSGLGIGIALNVFRGYSDSKIKNFLFLEAKFTIERLDRELRNSIPNSIRTNGSYLQYILLKDGFYYRDNSSDNTKKTLIVYQDNFSNYAIIGDNISIYNLKNTDIYTNNISSQKKYTISQINMLSQDNWSVSLNHGIVRNSPYNRLFLILTPVTIFQDGNKLKRCFGYNLVDTTGINEGTCNVLSSYIKNISFQYQPGTTRRNAMVKIAITYKKSDITLTYNHEVHLRNVP